MTTASPLCGTRRGYARHRNASEQACAECKAAVAAYQQSRRNGTHVVRTPKPCGTQAAYTRHIRARTKPCQACADAHAEYMAQWRRNRKVAAL